MTCARDVLQSMCSRSAHLIKVCIVRGREQLPTRPSAEEPVECLMRAEVVAAVDAPNKEHRVHRGLILGQQGLYSHQASRQVRGTHREVGVRKRISIAVLVPVCGEGEAARLCATHTLGVKILCGTVL